MVAVTRVVGGLLLTLGVVAWLVTGADSPTALLPALLGAAVLVAGLVAGREALRPHAIHSALVLALLGLLGSLPTLRYLPAVVRGDEPERGAAAPISALLTVAICAVYLALGVRSFIAARRSRG